jgi:hypothetical protein
LGDNYAVIGYQSPREMFDAFQAGERAHVLDSSIIASYPRNGASIRTPRTTLDRLRVGYNGSGRAGKYVEISRPPCKPPRPYWPRVRVPPRRWISLSAIPASTFNSVHLIPQPDKRSCWAASMSMVLSYYRQASVTPETLASE